MKKILFNKYFRLNIIFAFLFGLIGIFSFSPFNLWYTSILSLVGLQILIFNHSSKNAFWIAFCWGIGFFGGGIHWIYKSIYNFTEISLILIFFIITLFVLYLAIYPAIYAYILTLFFSKSNTISFILAASALWQIMEYLRSKIFTGFPWLQFGYSQINSPLKWIGPIFGVEMITMILVIISSCLVISLLKSQIFPVIISIILLNLPILFKNIHWVIPNIQKQIKVVLVQGNISQNLKWHPSFSEDAINRYINLSKTYFGKTDIIIWPESAITSSEFDNYMLLTKLDKLLKIKHTYLITGIVDKQIDELGHSIFFNTIITLGNDKSYSYNNYNRYQKHHLVPFGEFIPFRTFLNYIGLLFNLPMSFFTSGSYLQKQLIVGNIYLTATICYEIILGNQVRDNFKSTTDFLLTISNDAWFGNSIGPWQHFQMARMRALELGRPLLITTNNGITGIINFNGDIQIKLPQFITGVLKAKIIPTIGLTPYAYWSNWPMWILVILFVNIAFLINKKPFFKKNIV